MSSNSWPSDVPTPILILGVVVGIILMPLLIGLEKLREVITSFRNHPESES